MGELALRVILIVLDYGFEYVGYLTARVLVPLLTMGRCRVAAPATVYDVWSPSKDKGIQPATAATLGILFWLVVALIIFIATR